ncbi:MAG: isocitrate lyase/PEP mutase family protein [Pseudomonadota bacterium]
MGTGSEAARLADLLSEGRLLLAPCCFDGLTARLVEQAGFEMTFLSGFAASAARIGQPDLGLMSYGEVEAQTRSVAEATRLPFVADGDTGYGNAMNVIRTVKGLARAGAAAVMIEDQVAPKRCGHTPGKAVVDRATAEDRIRAAVDAQAELRAEGGDVLILARTDARHDHGLAEGIGRALAFREAGADITFVEAPRTADEMAEICREVEGPKLVNMLEGGLTPILPHRELEEMGFAIAAYPLTLLSAGMKAMVGALEAIREDATDSDALLGFGELRERLGFEDYYARAETYRS